MSQQGEFLQRLNHELKPRRLDIIEKDYHLHRLLDAVSRNDFLSENLVFKGGTCLVKVYSGYFRFSEDVDFTWKDSAIWQGKTPSQTRKTCSKMVDAIIDQLVPIAKDIGLEFTGNKSDKEQVIIGSGGRIPRFYLTYYSEILKTKTKTKMEVNFVERTIYPFQHMNLGSYLAGYKNKELELLFGEQYRNYIVPIAMDCYDSKEIFTDKCRAALTRKAYKFRDVLDIYFMGKQFGYTIDAFRGPILEKTRFMLELYTRYQENIELLDLPSQNEMEDDELKLLLMDPPENLQAAVIEIHGKLEGIRKEILS
jgi:hypothetical protein